jgi:gamma-glutamylcyclotransferase (GGCT)/AIG2-like uncharacterized protein YtfP
VTTLYFAYGSNLNLEQMRSRCPDAKFAGIAEAPGYNLKFSVRTKEFGWCNIEENESSFVPGCLWLLTDKCLKSLDHHEEHPLLYQRQEIFVTNSLGDAISAITYIMPMSFPDAPPKEEYVQRVRKGYEDCKLSIDYLEQIVLLSL